MASPKPGDQLNFVSTADGILLTPYDPDFERNTQLGRDIMDQHRDAVRALAR